MASIYGLKLRGSKSFLGREGYGLIADITLDGKKAGSYRDMGDGADSEWSFVSPEIEKEVMSRSYRYAKAYPNKRGEELYSGELGEEFYAEEKKRKAREYPYLDINALTKNELYAFGVDQLTSALENLGDLEKRFRSHLKKGYRALGACETTVHLYPVSWTDQKIEESAKEIGAMLYRSLEDFEIR